MDKDEKSKDLLVNYQEENRKLKQELSREIIKKEQAVLERNHFLNELTETRNSKTYKLAHALMTIPRKLRGYKYKFGELPDYQTLYPYMISIVIAVYNTADYLSEMVESILMQKQDILEGYLRKNEDALFRSHVFENIYEIILVDDGSNDGSEYICDSYAKKYPWIKVLHKENGGVSSARNAGIEIAQGKYITFPDSDDKLSANVMEECFRFFEAYENEISMVTYPLKFFDAQSSDHWTTYRFENGTRILDMSKEWDKPQYFTAATFFKTSFLRKKHILFESSLINGEDIKFVHEVLYNDKPVVGLISGCTYWYRRRSTGEQSAIQKSKYTREYYIPYITDLLRWMLESAKNVYGKVPKYVQYAVMGQLQWRLRTDEDGYLAKSIIGEVGFEEYKKAIKELIRQIDLDVIMEQKQLYREHFFYLCNLKTDGRLQRVYHNENVQYYFDDTYCAEAASCYLKLEFMSIKNGVLYLEGFSANLEPNCENWVLMGEEKKLVEGYERNTDKKILGETALFVENFKVTIPLTDNGREKLYFGTTVNGLNVIKTRIVLGKFMPISKELSKSYYSEEDWTIRLDGNNLSVWNMTSPGKIPDFEQEFEDQILKGKYGKSSGVKEAVAIRKQVLNRKSWKRNGKQIWLISDRYNIADDNGEVLYKYLVDHHELGVEIYFVIAEDSEDFHRLSTVGKVLAQDSKEHIIFYLMADCIISSQADEYIINPVWRKGFIQYIYKDLLCRKKYVFLQHGVIKDDLSFWLNRYNKNIDGFVCTAFREAQSLRDYNYYYDDEQIWLTGLPRYDRLYHNEKRLIVVTPTWRKWLMMDFNAADSDRDAISAKDGLKQTDYYKFYNNLINDSVLLETCEEYGYTLCFMPHPNLYGCLGQFEKDKRVLFWGTEKKYCEAFAEGNLLITDYSSTAMDFAYLRKPVIYAQFDQERFFAGEHTYQRGYFDYEQNGFGEVVYDLKTLVEKIIEYMKDDCMLMDVYKERIESFFAYNDQNNCQRVAEKIACLMEIW